MTPAIEKMENQWQGIRKMEVTQVSTEIWLDKQNMVYVYYSALKRKEN